MRPTRTIVPLAALIAAAFVPAAATAQSQPTGVWIDHTGRGAVEIAECGNALCGHIVWVQDARHIKTCRNQVIGNVRQVGGGTWDRGWIVDPDDNSRYSVELKPIGTDRLRVVGYMGSKLFSETMTWKRAPVDLKRCDIKEADVQAAAPATPPMPTPDVPPAVVVQSSAEPIQQRQASVVAPMPEAAPQSPAVAAEPEPQREARPRRQASGRSQGRECTLDLPYFTLKYPCDAF